MVSVIEVKDTITDTISILDDVIRRLEGIEGELNASDILLMQNQWSGESKDKCVQIHGLLNKYQKSIVEMLRDLHSYTTTLESDMQDFPANSDSIKIISSI